MSKQLPRSEHPRPDFHRGLRPGIDWLNLTGRWEFEFDPEDKGLEERWFCDEMRSFSRAICVPFPWESHLAWGTEHRAGNDDWFSTEAYIDPESVTRENYREAPRHTIGWYRREFEVPEHWQNRRVFLHIGAADWEVRVWVNGREVGEAESGYLPVEFDITEALHEDSNILVIRVHDPEDHSEQPIGKQVSNWYSRTSGIWQTVWLEPRSEEHIAEVLVHPDLAGERAALTITVAEPASEGLAVVAEVRASTGATAIRSQPVRVEGDGLARLALAIPDAIPWTPDRPHLYRLEITLLRDDEPLDTVHTQFGMRDIDVGLLHEGGPTYIRLNGEPIYLRGALDQNFHPEGVYAFPSDEAIKRDFMLAKEAGLNFLRLHIKTPDPRYCYWADRCGILLMCDMPGFGYDGYSEVAKQRWERNAWGQIRRDFNHPSIFAWCLFNETWGLGGRAYAETPERQAWVRECYESAKRLDPTRLVEDNSPCLYDHVVTDINSWHFYLNDYEAAREHIEEVVAKTHPGSEFNYVGGNTQGSEPLLNSEYGGISARMGDLDVSWCLRFLTNELRRHEKICGYVYTELTDIEWERNGLYDYDRSRKEFGYDPALLLGEAFIGIDAPPGMTVSGGDEVCLPVFQRPAAEAEEMTGRVSWRAVFTNALGSQRVLARKGRLEDSTTEGRVIRLRVPAESGLVHLQVALEDQWGRLCAGNFYHLEVVADNEASPARRTVVAISPGDGTIECDGEVECGEVEGTVQLLACRGSATINYDFPLPPKFDAESLRSLTFLCEMSGAKNGAPQTEKPSMLRCRAVVGVPGVEDVSVSAPDQRADARGALSHMHGFQGRYGEIVRVVLRGAAARKAARSGRISVRIEHRQVAKYCGGVTIYGARSGRYPCPVTLLLESMES